MNQLLQVYYTDYLKWLTRLGRQWQAPHEFQLRPRVPHRVASFGGDILQETLVASKFEHHYSDSHEPFVGTVLAVKNQGPHVSRIYDLDMDTYTPMFISTKWAPTTRVIPTSSRGWTNPLYNCWGPTLYVCTPVAQMVVSQNRMGWFITINA